MNSYSQELTTAIDMLANDKRTIFLGQGLKYPGHGMTKHFKNVLERESDRLIEMPVCEELQMGMSLGLAIAGFIPVSVYPRWNFLLLATNMLVSHLDKWELMTKQAAKVIIKVGVGNTEPLNPGPQHVHNYSGAFRLMCPHINIVELDMPSEIVKEYKYALDRDDGKSTILVEHCSLYN